MLCILGGSGYLFRVRERTEITGKFTLCNLHIHTAFSSAFPLFSPLRETSPAFYLGCRSWWRYRSSVSFRSRRWFRRRRCRLTRRRRRRRVLIRRVVLEHAAGSLTRRPPGTHVARKHFFPFALHLLQFHLLLGRQKGRNLVMAVLENLRAALHFVAMHRLKLGRGIGQDRLDFRLLIRGQIQLLSQVHHPNVPHLRRVRADA